MVGFPGTGGPQETWWIGVPGVGQLELELKLKLTGTAGQWGAVTSPGRTAAEAAVRQVIRETPRTLEHAADYARELFPVQAAVSQDVGGPMHALGLEPGGPPRAILAPAGGVAA